MAKDFFEDVWRGIAKQRRIQAQEQREKAKQSSSGGKGRGGRSRGYFSSSGGSGGKSLGMGRTSRISSSSYTHKTSVVVKKINPNSSKYNNTRTIRNALQYIAGLSETSEQKNENVKLTYINGYDKTPTTTQENQKEFVENFYQNLKNDINIPSEEETKLNPRKNPPLVQHIVFSLSCDTTENSKEISREKIAQLQERAILKLTQENEILRNHAILIAMHDNQKGQEEEYTNGVHFHLLKSNFNTQTMGLDRDFWSKEQIRNLQIEFAQNCRDLGLDIKIPPAYEKKGEEISEKQRQTQNLSKDLHKVKSIEYYKNGKAKSLVLQNLSNGEIFTRNDKDIARFVSENFIKIDDEFRVDLKIEKKVNAIGKEYTTFQWGTPQNRTNQREKQEQALEILQSNFQKLKSKIEDKTEEEDRYKDRTEQKYEGHKSIALQIYRNKISKIPQTEEEQKEYIEQLNNEELQKIIKNPNFYINLTDEEEQKIYLEETKWDKEKEDAFFKWLSSPEQRKLQEKADEETYKNIMEVIKEQKQAEQEQEKAKKKEEEKPKPIEEPKQEPKPQEPKQEIKEQPKPLIKEQEEIKEEIKKPQIKEEPKREFKPKPKKKDRGFSRW